MSGIVKSVAFLFVPFLVFGEVIEVDVRAWADVGTGTTAEGWEVNGIGRYADGGAQFSRASDSALSPPYADVVTQIVMSVKSSASNVVKKLMITPTTPKDATVHEAIPTASSGKYTVETFSWSVSEGVRQFILQEGSGSSGTWGVKSLAVYTDRIEPPTGLREDALYRDAFAATWDLAPKAVRYQVQYASVTRKQPSYETVAKWDFSSLTNTYGSTRSLDQLKVANPRKLDDLLGTNVCMQASESGHIQIGMGKELGCLVLPAQLPSGDARKLAGMLRAWKYPSNGKPTMPIYFIADGKTNDLATVELTNENVEYIFPIPDGIVAKSIILSSATNGIALSDQNGRVRVESFAIVSGYDPGSVTTNEFKSVKVRATAKVVKDLAPGEWIWSAQSFDAEGRDSPWSPFRTVILDPESRRYPCPGFGVSIR